MLPNPLTAGKVLASHPTLPALQRDKIGLARPAWAAVGLATGTGILVALRYGARPMKASSAHRLLPFETFGQAAAFDLEVEVSCQCRRRVVIDGLAATFRDRRIMGTRFRCTTMLPHGVACASLPSIYIRKRGRGRWTMAEHSRAIQARQAAAPIDAKPGTFASIVKRCEVAFRRRAPSDRRAY
jgi:hypothetical protein